MYRTYKEFFFKIKIKNFLSISEQCLVVFAERNSTFLAILSVYDAIIKFIISRISGRNQKKKKNFCCYCSMFMQATLKALSYIKSRL